MKKKKLQEEKITSQKSKSNIVVILLILAVIASSILCYYAYSKYTSTLTGNGTATVAKWNFKVNGQTEQFTTINLAETIDRSNNIAEGRIAPGTSGSFDLELDGTGSEVAIDYTITMDLSEKPQNLIFYTDSNYTEPVTTSGTTATINGYINLSEVSTPQAKTIYWNWPYQTGAGDSEINANDKIDTQDAGKEISVSISVTGTQVLEEPLRFQIGKSVNLSTTLNGVELNDWKVFYKEGDYTYLILGDYLANSAVNISGIEKNGDYSVYSNTSREHLINEMTTKANWNSLLQGSINGNSYDYTETDDENIYANGSPTSDLYIKSWNEKYSSNKLYTNTNHNGYYVGTSANPTTTHISLSNTLGYKNTLYYPHTITWKLAVGYWLASPSAHSESSVVAIRRDGGLNSGTYDYTSLAFRPIICLPSSILE